MELTEKGATEGRDEEEEDGSNIGKTSRKGEREE